MNTIIINWNDGTSTFEINGEPITTDTSNIINESEL